MYVFMFSLTAAMAFSSAFAACLSGSAYADGTATRSGMESSLIASTYFATNISRTIMPFDFVKTAISFIASGGSRG